MRPQQVIRIMKQEQAINRRIYELQETHAQYRWDRNAAMQRALREVGQISNVKVY